MKSSKYFRDKAEELRVIATFLCSEECRYKLIRTADSYEDMAAQSNKQETERDVLPETGREPVRRDRETEIRVTV